MPTVIDRLADAQTSREDLEVLNTISSTDSGADSIVLVLMHNLPVLQ